MKSLPKFLVGPSRSAIRVASQEADQGLAAGNEARLTRRRFGSEGEVERGSISLAQGRWEVLIIASRCDEVADKAAVCRRRRQ